MLGAAYTKCNMVLNLMECNLMGFDIQYTKQHCLLKY